MFFATTVYKAAGLGAYEMYDEINYDTWYQTQLLNELRVTDPRYVSLPPSHFPAFIASKKAGDEANAVLLHLLYLLKTLTFIYCCRYKIVRHRVVWLLGNWVSVKMATSLRPSLYSVLISVLQPSEDIVVSPLDLSPPLLSSLM